MAARVIQIRPTQIGQDEIERFLCLERTIRELTVQYNAIAADLLARLEAHAPVEPGLYRLSVRDRCTGGRRVTRLVIS